MSETQTKVRRFKSTYDDDLWRHWEVAGSLVTLVLTNPSERFHSSFTPEGIDAEVAAGRMVEITQE